MNRRVLSRAWKIGISLVLVLSLIYFVWRAFGFSAIFTNGAYFITMGILLSLVLVSIDEMIQINKIHGTEILSNLIGKFNLTISYLATFYGGLYIAGHLSEYGAAWLRIGLVSVVAWVVASSVIISLCLVENEVERGERYALWKSMNIYASIVIIALIAMNVTMP